MKRVIGLFAITLSLVSCSAEPIETVSKPIERNEIVIPQTNTFTVVWSSNQEGAYIEFRKHIFRDCKIVSSTFETHRENSFEITLDNNQMFDLNIKKEAPKKNPEITLRIYKGSELQYEQTVYSNGFLLVSFADHNGNIAQDN